MTKQQRILKNYLKYHTDLIWIQLLPVGDNSIELKLQDGSWKLLQLDDQGIWEWSETGRHLIASSWY